MSQLFFFFTFFNTNQSKIKLYRIYLRILLAADDGPILSVGSDTVTDMCIVVTEKWLTTEFTWGLTLTTVTKSIKTAVRNMLY